MASAQPKSSSKRLAQWRGKIFLCVGAVAIVVLLGVGIAAQSGTAEQGGVGSVASGETSSEPAFDMSRRLDGDPTALGSVDAPVVLIEFSDYRCPYCGVFARETLPVIIEEYVESGQLRVEWRDLVVFGDESLGAAIAGRAAGAQGMFWEFNEATFRDAPERAHSNLSRERLLEIARGIGVPDMARFESDLDNQELQNVVLRDTEEARSIGATGTPLFLVNDTPISGAQPIDAFRQAIDRELTEAAQ